MGQRRLTRLLAASGSAMLFALSGCTTSSPAPSAPTLAPLSAEEARRELIEIQLLFQQGRKAQAQDRLQKLAATGDSNGEVELGSRLLFGQGISADPDAAAVYLLRAAKHGNTVAEDIVGQMMVGQYPNSVLPLNIPEGLRYLNLAADKQSSYAVYALGNLYIVGKIVPRDEKKGLDYIYRAAELGNPLGLINVAQGYFNGRFVKRDNEEAFFWISAALPRIFNNPAPLPDSFKSFVFGLRDDIAKTLTAEQTKEIGAAAARWVPTKGALDSVRADAGNIENGDKSAEKLRGFGSGFIVNRAGYIVTNNHVIDHCASLKANLANGTLIDVTLLEHDPKRDLAILKAAKPFGDPVSLRTGLAAKQGEAVMVAGFPLADKPGMDLNTTTGTVSALKGLRNEEQYLQYTAPSQSGNSGGPLVDAQGVVIGVVTYVLDSTALASAGVASQNANFAIKADVVGRYLDEKGVAYDKVGQPVVSKAAFSPVDLSEKARQFSVQIACYK